MLYISLTYSKKKNSQFKYHSTLHALLIFIHSPILQSSDGCNWEIAILNYFSNLPEHFQFFDSPSKTFIIRPLASPDLPVTYYQTPCISEKFRIVFVD